jgi:hypothetical protein
MAVVNVVGKLQEAGGEVVEAVFHERQALHGRGCGILQRGSRRGKGEVEGDVGCQTVFDGSVWRMLGHRYGICWNVLTLT